MATSGLPIFMENYVDLLILPVFIPMDFFIQNIHIISYFDHISILP